MKALTPQLARHRSARRWGLPACLDWTSEHSISNYPTAISLTSVKIVTVLLTVPAASLDPAEVIRHPESGRVGDLPW